MRSMISLFVQTPMGDLIDKSRRKREYVALAALGVAGSGLWMVFFLQYWHVAVAMAIQGLSLALIAPAIYGLTLGLVGTERIAQQTAINEMCDHGGTVLFALCAGKILSSGSFVRSFDRLDSLPSYCCSFEIILCIRST